MGKKGQNEVWIMWILKSLLAAYVVTGILLMILAMALYKFELGILYFAFLLLITWGIYRTFHGSGTEILMTFALCAGGGMAGGMIS